MVDTMPEADVIDKEFLLKHRSKIQKIFTEGAETKKIEMRKITKDHLYPQIAGKSNAANAKKFIAGMEKNGLGKIEEFEGRPCFKLIDFENANAEELELCKEIGVFENNN